MYTNIFIDRTEQGRTVYIFDDKKGIVVLPYSQFNYAYVPDKNGAYLTMTGKTVSKKYNTRDLSETYESDVTPETRVLTDIYLSDDHPSDINSVLFFDIEVSMKNGIPNVNDPQGEITSIACYDSSIKQYTVFAVSKDTKTYQYSEDVTVHLYETEYELLKSFMEYYTEISPNIITGWNSNFFDVPYLYNRIRQQCGTSMATNLSPIGKVKYSEYREKYVIAGVSSLDYMEMYKKFTYTEQPNYRLDTIGRIEINEGKVEYEGSLDDLELDKLIEYNLQDVRILVKLDEKLKLIDLVRNICHISHIPYEDFSMTSRFLEGTILTYLHRKKIVATNKPVGGREKFEQQKEDDEEGFAGAFVKVPMPGLYEWVYSLDLQSLYPSIIMSLNISPETKMGIVSNWSIDDYKNGRMDKFIVQENVGTKQETVTHLTKQQFEAYMKSTGYNISANGVLYRSDKKGIIPEILDVWFAKRKEYKELRDEALNAGDKKLADFYDQRQHIQKIFLNSLYGVLGLAIFRFYDVDNALAVTTSGQEVIKNSAKFVNYMYSTKKVDPKTKLYLDAYHEVLIKDAKKRKLPKPSYPDENDHCIYIDTDSLYFSSEPFLNKFENDEDKKQFTIKLARVVESAVNNFYNDFAKETFFCASHRFYIKGEAVANTAVWLGKKRYALNKIYDLETSKDVKKQTIKGLDSVRSSFPRAFRTFMEALLNNILGKEPKSVIDDMILKFRSDMENMPYIDLAKNTAVKQISKYEDKNDNNFSSFANKTPGHVKAAITYNRLLKHFGLEDRYERIEDGAKIKYVMLKPNPLDIESVAIKGYNDPKEILDIVEQYIDYKALFTNELVKKLESFYSAMGWGLIPTKINRKFVEFFDL